MQLGDFDTDSGALQARIDTHNRFGSTELNDWIFAHVAAAPGSTVLDLGCGTGKQSLPLSTIVGQAGKVTVVDASSESLEALRDDDRYDVERIETIAADLDGLEDALGDQVFDRIVASYSIYYGANVSAPIRSLRQRLAAGGRLFVCGPSIRNNEELRTFHYALLDEDQPVDRAAAIMDSDVLGTCRELFPAVEVSTFENPLAFDTGAAVYEYWANYNLYDARIDADFRAAIESHFASERNFTTVKRALGVLASG